MESTASLACYGLHGFSNKMFRTQFIAGPNKSGLFLWTAFSISRAPHDEDRPQLPDECGSTEEDQW